MKECTNCKEVKAYSDFFKRKASKDGYQHRCKICHEAQRKAYRQTEKGKADRQIESKKYRENNYEKVKENNRRNNKKYRQTEKGREQTFRGNFRRRKVKGAKEVPALKRAFLLRMYRYTCTDCKVIVHDEKRNDETKANFDHIQSVHRGGDNSVANLTLLCRSCNLKKGAKY